MFQLTKKAVANLKAGELLVGGMIGVGIFGLPFAFAQAGFFVGMIYLAILGLATITLQLMYAEVTLQTPGHHRLVGFFNRYFNKKWASFSALVFLGGAWGALIAYILIGGSFLHSLLGPMIGGTEFMYQLVFLLIGFVISLGGLKFISGAEMYLVGLLLLVTLVIVVRGAFDIQLGNLLTFEGGSVLMPYGVILFSLGGTAIIPEMCDVLGRYRNDVRSVIIKGMLIVLAVYALFAMVVVGVTGMETSSEALSAFGGALGAWVLVAGVLMGFLAVATSFLMLTVEVQEMLEYDYKFTRILAWFSMMSIPLIVFLLGARDFIRVISFTGAVFGGLSGSLIVILYHRVRDRHCDQQAKCFQINDKVGFAIIMIFCIGAILEITRPLLERL